MAKSRKNRKTKKTRKTRRAGVNSPIIHSKYHAPGVPFIIPRTGIRGYDYYNTTNLSRIDRVLIPKNTVIPRTLPNSQAVGGIYIINMATKLPIHAFIRRNQTLKEVKNILSVQPEIDCAPQFVYFGMKKRFCGPEYWKAVLKGSVMNQGATNRQFERYFNGLKERLETDKRNDEEDEGEESFKNKWEKLMQIINQEEYFNYSKSNKRLDVPGGFFMLFVYRHRILNKKKWIPKKVADYVLELNERVEELDNDNLMNFKYMRRRGETLHNISPTKHSRKTLQELNKINNFTLLKFMKDYDMDPHNFILFVFPVVTIEINFAAISNLSDNLPASPIYRGRFSVKCYFSEVFKEAVDKLKLETVHGIKTKNLKYHPYFPVETSIPVAPGAEIDTYFKYKVMIEHEDRSKKRFNPYNYVIQIAGYFQ